MTLIIAYAIVKLIPNLYLNKNVRLDDDDDN